MEKSASKIIPFHVLVAAAGNGSRMQNPVPKQYRKLAGKAVLRHTLEAFLSCPGLASLGVIIDPSHEKMYRDAASGLRLAPPIHGGASRKQSVIKGLNHISHVKDDEIVLIHDAARPFIGQDLILAAVRALQNSKAATLSVPVTDTLRRADGANIGEIVPRENLRALQTPQAFRYGLLKEAHARFPDEDATDDTTLVTRLGHDVKIVEGSPRNFKITTEEDFRMAERIMAAATVYETRIGTGYDVHAFALENKSQDSFVTLCGVKIPHGRALLGHSDADAGLHALTDALLGAIGDGDIGVHFPPSDPQWKGADSTIFLREAARRVSARGGIIVNADITLICEAPKISPHTAGMRDVICSALGIAPDRIGIKATTSEKLGFTGRGEGIAAQAAVSVKFPESLS